MKKLLSILLAMTMLVLPCAAIEGIQAPSAILMDKNGNILFEKDVETQREPASVTKIMTMLLVMEAIDAGNLSLEDMVTTSAYASSMGGSQIFLKEGEKMSVHDMLKGVAVASANDAAVALAEHLGGTVDNFVAQMNKRAKELGMMSTHFVNPNGLPAEGHLTSAHDIAIMSKELIHHEKILEYTTLWIDSLRGGEFQLVNTNGLIHSYLGMTGLKTGFTQSAGYCLSATASREGLDLIAVTMGNKTSKERTADITSMLNYGFANYTVYDVTKKIELEAIPVVLGKEASCATELANCEPIVIEKGKIESISYEVMMQPELKAPVAKGDAVGQVLVKCGEETVTTIDVLALNDVPRLKFFEIYDNLLKVATGRQ